MPDQHENCGKSRCKEIAEEYDTQIKDCVISMMENALMCENGKINMLEEAAYKIACTSALMQTRIDPEKLNNYGLMLIPAKQVEEVSKYLATNFGNTIAIARV